MAPPADADPVAEVMHREDRPQIIRIELFPALALVAAAQVIPTQSVGAAQVQRRAELEPHRSRPAQLEVTEPDDAIAVDDRVEHVLVKEDVELPVRRLPVRCEESKRRVEQRRAVYLHLAMHPPANLYEMRHDGTQALVPEELGKVAAR